jgi:hypothetical protein
MSGTGLLNLIPLVVLAPDPPVAEHVRSATWEYLFFASQVLAALGTLTYATVASRRGKSLIPLMCVVGGALTIFLEPLIDSHLQVWWPIHHQPDVLNIWGRNVPMMIVFTVTFYFGLNTAMRYRWMQKNGPQSRLWTLYAIEVGCALLLEPPAIQLHLWHYYGEHGLRIFGYPIWWPFVGGACCMAAGTLIFLLAPYLTGIRVLLVPPILVMGVAAAYWGAGWPMFTVLNAEPSTWIVYIASFVSIGLAFLIVWMCTIATGHRDYRKQQREARRATSTAVSGGMSAGPEDPDQLLIPQHAFGAGAADE